MLRPMVILLFTACAFPAQASMALMVLGSGGPGAVGRAASCHVVTLDGRPRILVDAGPGCFARAGEAKLSFADLDIVLLTHLHADHAGDLPGLFKARAVSSRGAIAFDIFGPKGSRAFPATSRFIDLLFGSSGAFAYLHDFSAPMTFHVTDLRAAPRASDKPATILSENGLVISSIPGHHRDAPAVIYRIAFGDQSIVFTGDIDPQGHANLRKIAEGAAMLVFNSVVLDPPDSPPVLYTLHTTPGDIGAIAADAHVRLLVLAHLSPATDGHREAVANSIKARYQGRIEFAEDKLRVEP